MPNNELLKTLDKLHEELAQNPKLDEGTLRSMRSLLEEIQAAIAQIEIGNSVSKSEPSSIAERLQDLITDFESRHPKITATLSQIADRLTDMGI